MIGWRRASAIGLGLCACHGGCRRPAHQVHEAALTEAPAATTEAGTWATLTAPSAKHDAGVASAPPAVCREFVAEQRQLAHLWPESLDVPVVLGRCFATRAGAWAVSFDAVRFNPDEVEVRAHFAVVHLTEGATGPRPAEAASIASPLFGAPDGPSLAPSENYVLNLGAYVTDIFAPTLFDYDGDGEDELLFNMQAYVSEGVTSRAKGIVFTYRDGAVSSYEPAARFAWVSTSDIDHDGRPDLLVPYIGINLAAHALADGTFSTGDGAASAHARSVCPPGRRAVFVEPSPQGGIGWNGPCARVWGVTEADALRAIGRRCSGSPAIPCLVRNVINDAVIESAATYRRDAHVAPPIVLRDEAGR
jgi:hypothetical protein